jgi:hypothetical protein
LADRHGDPVYSGPEYTNPLDAVTGIKEANGS